MIILIGIILTALFITLFLIKNRRSQLPEHLKKGMVRRYRDLMTKRDIHIVTRRDRIRKTFVNEAFYEDDASPCVCALFSQTYGYMYYNNGELKVVSNSFAHDLLERNRTVTTELRNERQKHSEDIPE